MESLEKEMMEHFQKRVSAPIKCIKTTREEYDLYMAERRQVINNRKKELMLQTILGKLGVSSMDEFWENEKRIANEFVNKGLTVERKTPLLQLTKEEMDFLVDNGYVKYKVPGS